MFIFTIYFLTVVYKANPTSEYHKEIAAIAEVDLKKAFSRQCFRFKPQTTIVYLRNSLLSENEYKDTSNNQGNNCQISLNSRW